MYHEIQTLDALPRSSNFDAMKFRASSTLELKLMREIRRALAIPTMQKRDNNDSYFLLIIEA